MYLVKIHACVVLMALVLCGYGSTRAADAPERLRARELGVSLDGTPGRWNAITDVAGVSVGHCTLIKGDGPLEEDKGPVRTGVTVVFPEDKHDKNQVFAGWFTLNADGEMTGTTWIEESGIMEGPIALTNTHSVGTVHQAIIQWSTKHVEELDWSLPVVAETWDGLLNDINGFHVKRKHVFEAIKDARSGPVEEGNVGSGTGMSAFDFKAGIGTASRVVETDHGEYTVGVLVQANFGDREQLRIAGVPVGQEIVDLMPELPEEELKPKDEDGSIIVIIATDAPVLPHQLKRIAKRASLGIGRMGATANNGSGDIFIAFSTAHRDIGTEQEGLFALNMLGNASLNPIFAATVEATEEAIINALLAAETMTGVDGTTVHALPHDRLQEILKKHRRLKK